MSDHVSVGEELLTGVSDIETKCYAVDKSVKEGYFSLKEALKNYKLNKFDYICYKDKNIKNLFENQLDEDAPVNLETAKYLKEKGFNKTCEFFYLTKEMSFVNSGLKITKNGKKMNHNRFDEFIYSAPLVKDAKKYLS